MGRALVTLVVAVPLVLGRERDHQRGDQDRDPEQTADAAGAGQKAHGTRF